MKKIALLVVMALMVICAGCKKDEPKVVWDGPHSFVETIEVENVEVEEIHVEEVHVEGIHIKPATVQTWDNAPKQTWD